MKYDVKNTKRSRRITDDFEKSASDELDNKPDTESEILVESENNESNESEKSSKKSKKSSKKSN